MEEGYLLVDNTLEKIQDLIQRFEFQIGELGNGRFVKNIFDLCVAIQCNRL
ncbi:hypothetical protein [Synechocystis sp. LKSZ1]|uniref:hypothetical protein n=1 Tax=Synechocystis sp. LKSZ1 TaxID=3144951 RepID=UPI00336BCC7B